MYTALKEIAKIVLLITSLRLNLVVVAVVVQVPYSQQLIFFVAFECAL
jgi:hypothetical protein